MLKENSIIVRIWSSPKLFKMQSYTNNANEDMPLIKVENVRRKDIKILLCLSAPVRKTLI